MGRKAAVGARRSQPDTSAHVHAAGQSSEALIFYFIKNPSLTILNRFDSIASH